MQNSTENITTTAVSKDSLLETIYFTVTNSIVLRVPNNMLHQTLNEISNNIDFLDYRTIKVEDVSLQVLSNNLTIKRNGNLKNKNQNINENFHNYNIAQQSQDALIANLSLEEQVNYSTINLSIYQRQNIKREVLASYKNIEEYKPSFGRKILESILIGWEIISVIIIY